MNGKSHKQNKDTAEWKALVYFCHVGIRGKSFDPEDGGSVNDLHWPKLKQLAASHGLRLLLCQGMSLCKDRPKASQEIFLELEDLRKRRSFINMDHAREMISLIRLLAEKGVELIPYKGVVLGQEAFGDIGIREMSDIDLLMELDNFPVIQQLLLSRDYVPSKHVPEHFEAIFFKQNFEYNFDLYEQGRRKYHVEPHWKIGFQRWQTDLTYADIFPFTQRKEFFGTEINMLTPEGLLLTTSLHHGGEDRWNKLKYICDIAAILFRFHETIDWHRFLAETQRLKVRNIILLGMSLAHQLFEAPLADEVKALVQKKTIQKHTRQVYIDLVAGAHSANINTYFKDIRFHCALRQHLSTKFKVLYYHIIQIFVPTVYDVNAAGSQGKNYWWLFLTKPFRIWNTHIKKS